jgi:hypothetical protein
MDADQLQAMYRRWLLEEWGAGDYAIAEELVASRSQAERAPVPPAEGTLLIRVTNSADRR